jgi:hypothetical protein
MSDLTRRQLLKGAAATTTALALGASAESASELAHSQRPRKGKSVVAYSAPKMERIRAAFIGVGARGSGHVAQMLLLQGVEITAICDTHKPSLDAAIKQCVDKGRSAPAAYGAGPKDYEKMVVRSDVDIVLISTPWEWHVPMAVSTMRAGKHAFLEVPAALTLDECWQLVDTAEQTQRHCLMMENVNYGREELMVLNMCRLGVFGELLHGEAAYIHDLRGQMHEIEHGTGSWRTYHYTKRNGNLYPTHGLGPVAHYMGINRGDRFDFLCSVSSPARAREIYAREKFPAGHERRTLKFKAGDINTSLIQTALGRTIMVQWDEQLPRPYTRHNLIQGTRGVWAGFPNRIVREAPRASEGEVFHTPSTDRWTQGADLKPWFDRYDHPLWTKVAGLPENQGGHGGMDFVMLWRIVYCLRNGLPMDQSVYDAAAWSAVTPLSEASVSRRGRSMDFPDFTRGEWKSLKPIEIAG